jgi:hypothetical protein
MATLRKRTTAKPAAKTAPRTSAASRVKDLEPKREPKGARDASGNTVYIGGASGGVWKTTNF